MTRAATVTAERIDKALDGLAGIIAATGEAGRAYLPIFARLERELVAVRADDKMMAAALARAATKAPVTSDETEGPTIRRALLRCS